ncbi:MAG: amidohydrolase family protein [Armatimonadetes bacterium]|nr:amidohydrolase family protein [Armatimonadota bacterium]
MRRIALFALVGCSLLVFGQESGKSETKTEAAKPQAPKTVLLQNARVVVSPGKVLERASILLKDGKIAQVGVDISAPSGAEVIECSGLTAYPGLIHPFLRIGLDGAAAAPAGGGRGPGGGGGGGGIGQGRQQTAAEQADAQAKRDADPFGLETNLLTKTRTGDAKQKEVGAFSSLAKSGYGLAQVSGGGGLLGPTSAVFSLATDEMSPASVLASPGSVPVSFSARGFNSYPSSTMGGIAVVRQAFMDAQRFARLTKAGKKPKDDPALANLAPAATAQAHAIFDELNEVSFFQARKVAKELGLKPVYGFRSNAGNVLDFVKGGDSAVLLKGIVPAKPSIPENPANASIGAIRSYFNELQAGAELQKAGVEFCYAPSSTSDPLDGIRQYVRSGLSRESALASMTTRPAKLLGLADKAGTIEAGKLGDVLLTQGDLFDSSSQVMAVFVDGQRIDIKMPERKKPEEMKADAPMALMTPKYQPFPAPAETQPAFRLYRNATVWTMGPQGTLKNADVLIQGGKIVAVGKGLKAPAGCETLDATGKHLSPGIWDCHSHTGISGGVNEGTNMITVECRIGDVIDHTAAGIYRQLSGGTVGAQQLHGSANSIGGQSSPVKWQWGLYPTDFPIAGAPQGVKFALGQNPIREDATGGGGFGGQQPPAGGTLLTFRPRTRMGVEESIRRALQLGKEYNQMWLDFEAGRLAEEPRRDLQLEGLGEIAGGKRLIHSHGYRADELLMLVRVTRDYGARIATLQHVLEGYKLADEMAGQNIGGSTFADWWGYKLEAYDAIPYNAALMAERGVSVSVNSDSDNHARRLNQEAAKSMRYGDVSAEKALSFVTIEPAKQMGIADHTGSLEAGKDADMVVWSNEPTSVMAIALETYVDGVKRFDRANDAKQRQDRLVELQEARKVLSSGTSTSGDNPFLTSGAGLQSADAGPNAGNGNGAKENPTTAKFGIGPITAEPGTMRYARKALLISGATIHPMDGDPFVGDVMVSSNGKIIAVGKVHEAGGRLVRVNGRGKHVYPGLIDPTTGIGLNEIGQVPTSDDSSERGNFHPDYRVERVINPEWETMGVARQQGVLTVLVKPSGAGFAGQAALINTEGYTWEDLTIQGGVAMAYSSGGGGFNFGDRDCCEDQEEHDDLMAGQGRRGGGGGGNLGTSLETVTGQLKAARDYAKSRVEATADKPVARDEKQEAMLLVADGKMPMLIQANAVADIQAAVAWAEKEKVRIVLYGCSEAGSIAGWLAQKQVPIILNAVYSMPAADQPVDYFYSLPALLSKAGVKFCLTTDNDKDVRQIRDQAGWAAAYGMNPEDAARLITKNAAEVLGIGDRLGSIKPGMDGTLILTDGPIHETKTHVLRAWVEGREVDLSNKQTRLYDKYRGRPKGGK